MEYQTFRLTVRRRRGAWVATAPELPGRDAPTFTVGKLANLPSEAVVGIAEYLGVHDTAVGVHVEPPRRGRRKLPGALLSQVLGGLSSLGGVYLIGGAGASLLVTGVALAALGVLRESGRI